MRELNESVFKNQENSKEEEMKEAINEEAQAKAASGPQLTSETTITHPDEDMLDELYLPQLNEAVLKQSLIVKHQDLLLKIE